MDDAARGTDHAATIAAELAEICRSGDLDTLLCLFEMAAFEAQGGMDRLSEALRPRRSRTAERPVPFDQDGPAYAVGG